MPFNAKKQISLFHDKNASVVAGTIWKSNTIKSEMFLLELKIKT
jgi:hypothetical protein